jgi:hypothetical protein
MFETFEHAEIPMPPSLCPNGERLWSYAHLDIHAPWFYVEYAQDLGEVTTSSMYLLGNIDQLCEIAGWAGDVLVEVKVITPKHLNHTKGWQMDTLKQVIKATYLRDDTKTQALIYVLEDGRELMSETRGELLEKVLLCSFD